jgi:hypothetical protein
MSTVPYVQLQPVKPEDFASEELLKIAQDLTSKDPGKGYLIDFKRHLNEIPCSFRKHGLRLIEGTLRVKYGEDLNLDFDTTGKREEKSSWEELFLDEKLTSSQNADFQDICENLKAYFKSKSHSFEKQTLENLACSKLAELVEIFYSSIQKNELEIFRKIKKRQWLAELNLEKVNVKQKISDAKKTASKAAFVSA